MKEVEIITKASQGERKGAIVFLHGACHGAWCWENYLNFFPRHGYESCALSLPGHGGSWGRDDVKAIRFQDYVDAVLQALHPYDGEAVLVGHSLGGTIIQKVLADYPDVASAGVLLSTGIATWISGALKEMAKAMLAPKFRQIAGMMSRKIPDDAETIRDSGFFNGRISLQDAERWRALLVTEPPNAMCMKLSVKGKTANIPMMVLASSGDVCSSIVHQERIAASYKTKPIILEGICHDMMLDPEWEVSANEILRFVDSVV